MERKILKTFNITSVAFSLIVLTLFVTLLVFLFNSIEGSVIPYDRDEAHHAIDGWEVYLATKNLSWAELDWAIRNQAFYPPVNSFFVAAGYLILGPSLVTGRLVTLSMFAGAVIMLGILTYKTSHSAFENPERTRSALLIGAAFSILLAMASELFVLHGTVVMIEMSGAFLALLLFYLASQQSALSIIENHAVQIIAALCIFFIFLTKYSFVFFAPALIISILTRSKDDFRDRSHWKSTMVVTFFFLFFAAIWVWLLYDRQSFLGLFNEYVASVPLLSLKNIFFYPRVWLYQYSPSPTWGIIVLVLAVIAVKNYWKNQTVRLAAWSVIIALITRTISTINVDRHILVAIPLVWFLAGLGLSHLIKRTKLTPLNRFAVPVLLTFVLVSFAFETSGFYSRLPQRVARYFQGKPVYSQLENFIIDNTDFSEPVALYGDFADKHDLEAIRWRAGVSTGQSLWDLHIDRIPFYMRESDIDRANRKSQLSDSNPNDLYSSLLEVIDSGYYSYIVEEVQLDDEMPTTMEEMDPSLAQYIVASSDFEDWRVNIYRLED